MGYMRNAWEETTYLEDLDVKIGKAIPVTGRGGQ
jgi:hypothetical protein